MIRIPRFSDKLRRARDWVSTRRTSLTVHGVLFIVQVLNLTNIIAMRYAAPHVNPFVYTSLKFLVATPVLFVATYSARETRVRRSLKHHIEASQIMPKGPVWLWLLSLPVLGVVLNNIFLATAMRNVSASNAAIFLPVVTALTLFFSLVSKQDAFTWKKLAAILLSVVGMVMLFGVSHLTKMLNFHELKGSLFMLGAVIATAICLTIQKIILKDLPLIVFVSWSMLFGGTVIWSATSVLFITGVIELAFQIPPYAWACILFSGLFGTAVACVGTIWTLNHTSSATVTTYNCIQILAAPAAAWLILDEPISFMSLLGAPFILLGLLITVREQNIRERCTENVVVLRTKSHPSKEKRLQTSGYVAVEVLDQEPAVVCSPRCS
ncbi:hypothetical protein PROFUN_07783 [Planoprotostelium fungivorum]|uniref:EamA domain-containing protein n=1 Tax=Planoprotostelium fungivorum TaxID=1890364 RepID=A0A2P6MX43_9EUKA|nr:hypothetical protein PROFUN_07783 [Planoprotostelium fungivorum]